MSRELDFDRALTVNELILAHPSTVGVFNRLGIDACCGGDVPVDAAAVRDGVSLEALHSALAAAIASEL